MKALALFSGGLDSILAIKLIKEQGIDVIAVKFSTHFFSRNEKSDEPVKKMAKKLKVPLKLIDVSKEYLKILKKPKHGYGAGVNPCIDCKIFMIKQAKKLAKKLNAKFLITGEVIGERPMSQNLNALRKIESEAGLKGKLLRPLSAKLLPETEAEKKGWVNREKLMGIEGRVRKQQMELAKKYKINNYPPPAGGCLLVEKEFAKRFRDIMKHQKRVTVNDVKLLKLGRHFRLDKNKAIVGRNEEENNQLFKIKQEKNYLFDVVDFAGPYTILSGPKTKKAIKFAAELTAAYSDCKEKEVEVNYGTKKLVNNITVEQVKKEELIKFRI